MVIFMLMSLQKRPNKGYPQKEDAQKNQKNPEASSDFFALVWLPPGLGLQVRGGGTSDLPIAMGPQINMPRVQVDGPL